MKKERDYLEENLLIEDAIVRAKKDPSKDNMITVLEMIRFGMRKDNRFLVPVDIPASEFSKLDMSEVGPGDPIQTKEILKFKFRSLAMQNGEKWFVGFTSREELMRGDPTLVIDFDITDILKMVLNTEEISGFALNPWGKKFLLKKEIIQMMFDVGKQRNQIYVEKGNIVESKCMCIVNAANSSLLGGGGVDGAIHAAAGPALLEECRKFNGCKTGDAKLTKGYHLRAKYVIHTVGPVYSQEKEKECEELLKNCYWNSLELAKKNQIHSIAFPAISTGAYGYPLEKAVPVAVRTISNWISKNKDYGMAVVLCCFDNKTYQAYQSYRNSVTEKVEK